MFTVNSLSLDHVRKVRIATVKTHTLASGNTYDHLEIRAEDENGNVMFLNLSSAIGESLQIEYPAKVAQAVAISNLEDALAAHREASTEVQS